MFRVESMGKPRSVSEEHFPKREKLARFRGNVFPGGETLPGSWGTFSQAGKPCPARGEHFPGREKFAALVGNIFPGGETLPGSWGTFSQAGKPCRAARQAFNDNMLAAIISLFAHIRAYAIRPYSFWRNTYTKRHHPSPYPQRINGKYVGAYRIRPSHERTCQAMGTITEIRWIARRHHFPFRPHQGVCDTPLQFLAKYLHEMMPSITAS